MSSTSLFIEKFISAPIEQIYRAFTNSTAIREWMCDVCLADPRPGGRLYFGWNSPFYAVGEFTALEHNHSINFTWQGRGEPGPTWVKVTLEQAAPGVSVHLEHGGLGEGETWEMVRHAFQMNWDSGLQNLVSVLETGRDLRIVNRPMLGVYIGQFDPELAQRLGVPVTQGVRLEGVVDGMGAQVAGLLADSVIVRLGKTDIKDYGDMSSAMQAKQAGDEIEVEYYQGSKKNTALIKLSGRPIPEIPPTAKELSAAVEAHYAEIMPSLEQLFLGVSEAQASSQPAVNEWSAKEVLAHLIHSERGLQISVAEAVGSAEATYDNYSGNWAGSNYATLEVFPSVPALLEEYQHLMQETIVLFSELPPEFVARKSSYWRLVFNSLQISTHFKLHLNQIKAALEATQGGLR